MVQALAGKDGFFYLIFIAQGGRIEEMINNKYMSKFITNSGTDNLKERLVELITKSEELKFLVGFFYFSGIRELYQGLKNNPDVKIKVLVGLNVDKNNYGLLEYAERENQLSDEERTYKFFESIKKSINTEHFDKKDFYEQVKFFLSLIREDRLLIRKTYNPNHAKLYIFKLQDGQVGRKNLFITGSSNLTNSGLSTQEEFNVEISDYGFADADKYFDALWDEAVKITEEGMAKKKLLEVIENETLVKEITPFEAFVLVLENYISSFDKKEIGQMVIKILEENGYTPYRYQLDAVSQALAIIEKNNGVIIADVVGLGKTVIACAVAKELGERGMVICPPGLVGDKNKKSGWEKYLEEFKLYGWEARSLGDLENIAEFSRKAKDIELIIIDEAHRFRNQDTKDYENLINICRGKIVLLLTATPFNNRPGDILALLKLFITPKKSSITLENNLVDKFRSFKGIFDRLSFIKKYWNCANENKRGRALAYYEGFFEEKNIDLAKVNQKAKYLSAQIRDVIKPVTIRRNRLDLKNNPYYRDEVKHLSKIADPKEWFYELTKEQSEFYDKIIKKYFGGIDEGGMFKGAIYRPFEYEAERKNEKFTEKENFQFIQQRNLYDFMRRLIVKRFESSFGAFRQSIKNFKKITETALEFIEKTGKYILDRNLLEKIYDKEPEEIELYLNEYSEKIKNGEYPKSHKIYEVEKFVNKDEFFADMEADLELFNKILDELEELDLIKNDPKAECLIKKVKDILKEKQKEENPKRKIIIFSEYIDTIKYLESRLKNRFGGRMLTVAGDLSAQKISAINKNFDASYESKENDFDILLSSDKISEGFNLNRAGMVINYDIPWNPVRVIQRVGRINRISKKVFEELYIVNFFPTEQGAELVKSREIAQNKMFLIHNTLGEDSKIFHIDEEPSASGLYKKIQQNPDKMEEENFYTKALNIFEKIKKEHPELVELVKKYPPRVKVAKKYSENEMVVFIKKGRLYIYDIKYGADGKDDISPATFEEVFEKISCAEKEPSLPFSGHFWEAYKNVKNFKEYCSGTLSEQSIEQKALNNLNFFINKIQSKEIMPHKNFLRMLREDILDYGALSDYTLRRIANLGGEDEKKIRAAIKEIEALKNELGENYLEKEKARQKDLSKEIIIAIENIK